jgi:hypothetical protein
MKQQIYAVYDSKAEAYMQPFFLQNDAMAIRGFNDAANKDTPIAAHPEDYTLFHIGEYSEIKGEITPKTPRALGNAIEFSKREKATEFPSLERK